MMARSPTLSLLISMLVACSAAPADEADDDVGALGVDEALTRFYRAPNATLTLVAPDPQGALQAKFTLDPSTRNVADVSVRVLPTFYTLDAPQCRVFVFTSGSGPERIAEVRQDPVTPCSGFARLDGRYRESTPGTLVQIAQSTYVGSIVLAEDGAFTAKLVKPESGGSIGVAQGVARRGFGHAPPNDSEACLIGLAVSEEAVIAHQFGDCRSARDGRKVDGTYLREASPTGG